MILLYLSYRTKVKKWERKVMMEALEEFLSLIAKIGFHRTIPQKDLIKWTKKKVKNPQFLFSSWKR